MSTCLRCDGCGNVCGEHDGELRQWWRLTRFGQEWVDEPGQRFPSMIRQPIFVDGLMMGEPDGDGELSEEEIQMLILDEPPEAHVLHFCRPECISLWATQASALEPD